MIRVHYPFHPDKTCLCIKIRTMSQKHCIPASYDRITENRYL
ncbi:hypothetical protein FORC41_0801 [Escherichia coli]|nr:hypothetical protein FORC41_0801 [Escherichia coli]EGW68402.1 hypothetical protein ECSTECB2F1_3196 [Escherichia coli O91:H21 str. B2F1]EGW81516.1 hypothetical protein ECSTEC94C_3526 [Escherichia coli STEC_94C]